MPPAARRPLVIGHRGASAHAPENTLAAFRLAIESGANGVELDVRLSKDGVPVVVHDRDLKRLAGSSVQVASSAASELARVDLGTFFNDSHPRHARPEFAGAGVPTLDEVLQLFVEVGSVHIELKIDKKRELTPLVSEVCRVIHSSPILPRIVLSSFRLTAIAEAKHLLPSVRTSALFAPSIMRFLKRRRHMIALARAFGANEVSLNHALATRKFTKIAHDAGVPVNLWTCNNLKWVGRSIELGINAVITNYPAEFAARRQELIQTIG